MMFRHVREAIVSATATGSVVAYSCTAVIVGAVVSGDSDALVAFLSTSSVQVAYRYK